MLHTVFILSETQNNLSAIVKCMELSEIGYQVVDKGQLMAKLYTAQPSAILIDLMSFQTASLTTISMTLSINYIPTICLFDTPESQSKMIYFEEAVGLHMYQMESSLLLLLRQAVRFSSRFNRLSSTYDTMDLMDSALTNTVDAYLHAKKHKEDLVLIEYLYQIFVDNYFLFNKPSRLWILSITDEVVEAKLFHFSEQVIDPIATIQFAEDPEVPSPLILGESLKPGFMKNFETDMISDVDDLNQLLPKELLSTYTPHSNLVSFGTQNTILIGCDYQHVVTPYDINIIKALTIKLDLADSIRKSMQEVQSAFNYTMDALARAAEAKDDMTGHHIKRVNLFSKILAETMHLDTSLVEEIEIAAQMHDVGKIYVDESILKKPGKLTPEEFETIKKHTLYGAMIIGSSKNLKHAAEIARSHHEKYDGTGYPDGKKGEDIPLFARIVSLADIYDALRSKRSYKPGFSHEEAVHIIMDGDGRVEPAHFDPVVLSAFKHAHLRFKEVYEELIDE